MNVSAYYRSALMGLRYVEHQRATGRRFGSDADARWKALQGALTTTDRIDLLIRDADAQWPGAFGPRTVFNFDSVAEDEPFGAPWPGMRAVDAEELWREGSKQEAPTMSTVLFGEVAGAWNMQLGDHEVRDISPADKLLVVGPSAVCALVEVFANAENLDWVDQVVCIATLPVHRQVAALAWAVLNTTRPAMLLAAGDKPVGEKLQGRRLIASDDAEADDLVHAKEILEA